VRDEPRLLGIEGHLVRLDVLQPVREQREEVSAVLVGTVRPKVDGRELARVESVVAEQLAVVGAPPGRRDPPLLLVGPRAGLHVQVLSEQVSVILLPPSPSIQLTHSVAVPCFPPVCPITIQVI